MTAIRTAPGQGARVPRAVEPAPSQYFFKGMRDTKDPLPPNLGLASMLSNCYPESSQGGSLIGRPGIARVVTGIGAGELVLDYHQFRKLNGTEYSIVATSNAGNVKLYSINWGTLTATNIVHGQTIQGNCYLTTFADRLIINDEVNKPVAWDGTTFTLMANCPVLRGQPVVFSAKLTAIKNTTAGPTLVWSEENDPFNGYDNAPYDNVWVLGQTSSGDIWCLAATEEALYFSRRSSWSAIYGKNEDQWRQNATREAVDVNIGCVSPRSVVVRGQEIWFRDQYDHPAYFPLGGRIRHLWDDYFETWKTLGGPFSTLSDSWSMVYLPDLEMMAMRAPNGPNSMILTWQQDTKAAFGKWVYTGNRAPGIMRVILDANNNRNVLVWQNVNDMTKIFVTELLYASQVLQDANGVGGNDAIIHTATGAQLGWMPSQQKTWESLTALFRGTALTSTTLSYQTPQKTSVAFNLTAAAAGAD